MQAKATFESTTVGPASDTSAVVGRAPPPGAAAAVISRRRRSPVISARQQATVRQYIELGQREGATLVTGGADRPEGLERGYFVRPTIFKDVSNAMRIAQEEIFGPVLCIIPYDTEEEAVAIANDSPYGLSGAVSSSDPARAAAVARRIRTGELSINGGKYNPLAPFGGYKQSGVGREKGMVGIEEYFQCKAINLPKPKARL